MSKGRERGERCGRGGGNTGKEREKERERKKVRERGANEEIERGGGGAWRSGNLPPASTEGQCEAALPLRLAPPPHATGHPSAAPKCRRHRLRRRRRRRRNQLQSHLQTPRSPALPCLLALALPPCPPPNPAAVPPGATVPSAVRPATHPPIAIRRQIGPGPVRREGVVYLPPAPSVSGAGPWYPDSRTGRPGRAGVSPQALPARPASSTAPTASLSRGVRIQAPSPMLQPSASSQGP